MEYGEEWVTRVGTWYGLLMGIEERTKDSSPPVEYNWGRGR